MMVAVVVLAVIAAICAVYILWPWIRPVADAQPTDVEPLAVDRPDDELAVDVATGHLDERDLEWLRSKDPEREP